jgi:hypothetical protein
MTDELGTVAYSYNELSQMTSESRNFTDTLSNEPSTGLYTLEYTYNLSGGLKSLKDPFAQQFNYVHDEVGRLQSVTGSTAFDGITSYASSPSYTARGTLKGLSYGNGVQMSVTAFNNKLQATKFEVKKGTTSYIKKEYQFYADGSLKFVDDMLDETFDRLYKYDHAGRTVEAKAGTAARGDSPTGPHNLDQPYTMAYEHDAFGHITSKTGYYYSSYDDNSYSYTNNRAPNWHYDSDGNTTSDQDAVYGFDAAGHLVKTEERELDGTGLQPPTIDSFDGAGQLVKRVRNFGSTTPAPQTNYFIHSSVLGKVVSEADETGRKLKTFVPANGVTLAQQQVIYYQGTTERLTFVHQDASTTGTQETNDDGTLVNASNRSGEYDPLGRNIASAGPYITLDTNPQSGDGVSGINMFGSGEGYRPGQQSYRIDHLAVPASLFMEEINTGIYGGAFGLLEMVARMSNRLVAVGVNTKDGPIIGGPGDEGRIIRIAAQTGNTLHRFFVQDTSWSVVGSLMPIANQQVPLAPLSKKRNAAIHNARTELTNILKKGDFSEDCQKNVIDKLNKISGFSLEKFIHFLELGGDFYDGTTSTALANDYNPDYKYLPTKTVADTFSDKPQTAARTASGINTRFTVFFRPSSIETGEKKSRLTGTKISGITNDNLAFIFHEGLHGFGHYSKSKVFTDPDLQRAFDLTEGVASINISEHIKQNCLEYTD